MRKYKFCRTILISLLTMAMVSCSDSVNQSDPKAVAEAALVCKTTGDYESMKKIIKPSNTYTIEQIDKMIALVKEMKEKGTYKEEEKEQKTFTFKSIHAGIGGGDFTDEATSAKVFFEDSEGYIREVVLEKENGKWYVERVN
ncbi:hypothetical protein HPS57_11665 [Prevotella sp. PINT]|uniref:DUF4878 domain-containing protein n=1 Tax=Palleniella intestinalis TaxID=2736291 RepID=UPI0015568BC5|nr:DUF4878 domain-containing protein [Palleniella intestinalis]NPD82623.1 hypothetical protein [Palleniella intestinalis]